MNSGLHEFFKRVEMAPWFMPGRRISRKNLKNAIWEVETILEIPHRKVVVVDSPRKYSSNAQGTSERKEYIDAKLDCESELKACGDVRRAISYWNEAVDRMNIRKSIKDKVNRIESGRCGILPGAMINTGLAAALMSTSYANPFEALFRVYEQGLVPLGPNGNKFYVWKPNL